MNRWHDPRVPPFRLSGRQPRKHDMTAITPIHRLLLAGLSLLLVLAVVPARAQQATPAPLQERMSYAQFKRLGLDKLTPAQLDALNAWLREHGETGPALDAAPASSNAPRPAAPAAQGNADIHARIKGSFRGWDNGTVFTLDNGQRWKVSEDSQLMMRSIDNPKVTLRKGFFGSWLLSLDGTNETVRVTQQR